MTDPNQVDMPQPDPALATRPSETTRASGTHPAGQTIDISEQKRTFNGFLGMLKWSLIGIAIVLIFLALTNA